MAPLKLSKIDIPYSVMIGILLLPVVLWLAFRVIVWLYENYSSPRDLKELRCAMVTGASAGIGKALALALAREGLPEMILISRRKDELQVVKCEVEKAARTPIKVVLLSMDVGNAECPGWVQARNLVQSHQVGLLVNCAGQCPCATYLHDLPDAEVSNVVRVNLLGAMLLTRMVYGAMVSKNLPGVVAFLGSAASTLPASPLYAVYTASKGGLASFASALRAEACFSRVTVVNFAPMLVATQLAKIRNPNWFVPSPDDFSSCVLGRLKTASRWPVSPVTVSPFRSHRLQEALIWLLPEWIWVCLSYAASRRIMIKGKQKRRAQAATNEAQQTGNDEVAGWHRASLLGSPKSTTEYVKAGPECVYHDAKENDDRPNGFNLMKAGRAAHPTRRNLSSRNIVKRSDRPAFKM